MLDKLILPPEEIKRISIELENCDFNRPFALEFGERIGKAQLRHAVRGLDEAGMLKHDLTACGVTCVGDCPACKLIKELEDSSHSR